MQTSGRRASDTLETLWSAHQPRLKRTLLGLTRNLDLAEDILQETHIKAARNFRGYRGGSAAAWLGTIARNTFYSHARKHAYNAECPLEDAICRSGGMEPGSGSHIRLVGIRAAISELPARLREALIMKHYDGYTYEEIAERLNCPSGTVKRRVHDAVQMLRTLLDPDAAKMPACRLADRAGLMEYLYGLASEQDAARIESHLPGCPACSDFARQISGVIDTLEASRGSLKLMELIDLDPQGAPTLYYDSQLSNCSDTPIDLVSFRMNPLSTLLEARAQGEKTGWERVGTEHFDCGSDRLERDRYAVPLSKAAGPGEDVRLLAVSQSAQERCARQLDDGRFRFRWTQYPAIRWALDSGPCRVAYSQAIVLPRHSRYLKAYPTPAQVRTGERTALIWTSQISRFEPFDSVVEYRVEPDWHAIAE